MRKKQSQEGSQQRAMAEVARKPNKAKNGPKGQTSGLDRPLGVLESLPLAVCDVRSWSPRPGRVPC